MKKQMVVGVLSALVLGFSCLSYGDTMMQPPPDPFLGIAAKALDLTSDQQTQIQALLQAERETDASLIQQEMDLRKQLRQAEWATSYDEATVQALAASLAQVEEQLIVSRTKTRFQISALLTSPQRALAQKLEPEPGHRPGPPPGQ